MNPELLRELRNLLLKTAAVSALLSILVIAPTMLFWDAWSDLTAACYHLSPAVVAGILVEFIGWIKFYVIFILLAPALAIHWTIKSRKSRGASSAL